MSTPIPAPVSLAPIRSRLDNVEAGTAHQRPVVSRKSPVLIAPQSTTSVWAFVKKAEPTTAQKYVLLSMIKSVVTTTDSEGGTQDLWRLGTVTDIAVAYAFYKGTPTLGTTHVSGTHAITTQNTSSTLLGPNGNGAKAYWRTQQQGDYVEFANIQGPIISVGTITSATGATANVYIDGILAGSYTNLSSDSGKVRAIEFRTTGGPHTVRVQHADATASRNCYVFGVNFFEVENLQPGSQYDNLWYGRDDATYPGYITNTGANEYALWNVAAGKWAGNFHGGETELTAPVWRLDGTATTLSVGTFYAARSVTLDQQTTIAWASRPADSMTTRSRFSFHESGLSFECEMHAAQDVEFRDFYTHMTKAAPTFTRVTFPASVDTTDTTDDRYDDGFFVLGRTNRIVQMEPSTGRTITSWFTLHPIEVTTREGVSVLLDDVNYRKVYYGLCQGSARSVRRAAWESVWLFN